MRTLILAVLMMSPLVSHGTQPAFDKIFEGKDGCFVLYDVNADPIVAEYNKVIPKLIAR